MRIRLDITKNGKREIINSVDTDIVSLEEKKDNGRYTITLYTNEDVTIHSCVVEEDCKFDSTDLFFCNGYQSWTDSFEYNNKDVLNDLRFRPYFMNKKFAFDRYGDVLFREYKKTEVFGYDVCYAKGKNNVFIGNLNYNTALLVIYFDRKNNKIYAESEFNDITINKDTILIDIINSNNIEDGMKDYFSHFKVKTTEKIFGYTSWYNAYQNINEKLINECLDSMDERFNLFQIDDGYETFVGDWLDIDPNKFPNGLEGIVKKIHEKNMKAGVWLAPFAAEEKSKTFNEHKDWFISKNGKPYKCGGNWSGFYSLDIYNPEAREYIKTCLKKYVDLGFDFFKLDFLYGESIITRNNKTRAMITKDAYDLLCEVLDGKEILGCGAILSPAFGRFDYMRIGPDVSLEFDDVFYMRLFHRERISTKTTLRNTIYRSFMNNNVFVNDPDVFLLRDDNIKLSPKQKEALITINALFGGVMMTSDNIGLYDDKKKASLNKAFNIFRNATDRYFERQNNRIYISYVLDGNKNEFYYNIEEGILEEA